MTSKKLGYYQDRYEVVARFNNSNSKYTLVIISIAVVLVIIIFPFIASLSQKLSNQPSDITRLAYFIPLFLLVFFLHEPIHFIPLWFFSKQIPQYRVTYVLLRPNVSISRKEGFVCYLLPFLVITITSVAIAFFVDPISQLMLIIVAIFHASLCCYDFIYAFLLLRCRGNNIRLAHEKTKKGFDTIIYLYEPNK